MLLRFCSKGFVCEVLVVLQEYGFHQTRFAKKNTGHQASGSASSITPPLKARSFTPTYFSSPACGNSGPAAIYNMEKAFRVMELLSVQHPEIGRQFRLLFELSKPTPVLNRQ